MKLPNSSSETEETVARCIIWWSAPDFPYSGSVPCSARDGLSLWSGSPDRRTAYCRRVAEIHVSESGYVTEVNARRGSVLPGQRTRCMAHRVAGKLRDGDGPHNSVWSSKGRRYGRRLVITRYANKQPFPNVINSSHWQSWSEPPSSPCNGDGSNDS
jgi:hypothetical protein